MNRGSRCGGSQLKLRFEATCHAAHIAGMTTQLREKDKGRGPHGGRYAEHERAEADIFLDMHEPDDPSVERTYYEGKPAIEGQLPLHEQTASPYIRWADRQDPTPGARATDEISFAEALAVAANQFDNFTRGSMAGLVERDDVVQDALIALVRRSERTYTGLTPGLVTAAVRAQTIAAFGDINGLRHEDKAGLRKFDNEVEKTRAELGRRHLTAAELDDIAARVRDNWVNPRNKPRIGFHTPKAKTVSLDEEYVNAQAQEIPAMPLPWTRATAVDDLIGDLDAGVVDKDTASRRLWNTFARDSGTLPAASSGTVTQSRARTARRAIKDVRAAAAKYLAGTANPEETKALFTPWGSNITEAERRATAELLTSRSDKVATGLWRSAVATASTPEE